MLGVACTQPLNDMVAMCYGGRYVILLNGIFGAYVGVMYNEVFAFPMNFCGGSRWEEGQLKVCCVLLALASSITPTAWLRVMTTAICDQDLEPYPFGIDPVWHYSANKITFFNSFKMKISIVVGVIQMTVGIILSLLNHLEYKDYKKVFFQFIPEFVFFNVSRPHT